ncbi:cyclophilin-type peptidyl-prolyl cis-trans isomerase [Corynespora cassiicola Philippines]|uniref:Peptidyl-prolyl cis-trans isomerase-like 1 n=1 Tax=Corynespora cassiicola Philippines TaxID=1448308 RepID=A0A2T2N571_CORCC|nr:cyclophilin-type peptidyl-prolyl cis-trans isomerase [Corynespora cassiicola Philippines]
MTTDRSVSPRPTKRAHSELEAGDHKSTKPAKDTKEDDSSDDDDDFGPALPSDAPKKKKRKLAFEKLYMEAMPAADVYYRSWDHFDRMSFTTVTPHTEFLITSSVNGDVKFWKKTFGGIEFVKKFAAHTGEIVSVSVSEDGRSYATAGKDSSVKIYDVPNWDIYYILNLDFQPNAVCWVHNSRSPYPLLAVSSRDDSWIRIYDGSGERTEPVHILKTMHKVPVSLMAYNKQYDCVISVDEGGMIEYWRPDDEYVKPDNVFARKTSTNLYEFKKVKSVPTSITISPTGKQFVTFSFPDRKIRLFDFASGKLQQTYNESIETIAEKHQAGTAPRQLEDLDFNRKISVERNLEPATYSKMNVIFDESGHFILYGSMYGVEVRNTFTDELVKVYGQEEKLRPLWLSLYQGRPEKKDVVTVEMAASENPLLQEAAAHDAMLISTATIPNPKRFYLFTNDNTPNRRERDIVTEKPLMLGGEKKVEKEVAASGTTAILHTTYGDITIRLYPEAAPKAVENFVTHARNGYYNNIIFHRVIRKFMLQTGDPLGDGTGGESIWNKDFEDEFSSLKHDKPYTVSMANAGPNTNASQFFITTEKAPWLDNKHTIFGRAIQGLDVVHKIENTKVYKERPEEDIKIINITIT